MLQPTMVSDHMRYWRIRPDARLVPWVHCYFVVAAIGPGTASTADRNPDKDLLLPDGHSEIVFSFGAGFERWGVDAPERRAVMQPSYLIGGRSHSVLTRSLGPLSLVGVKLDSRALRALIGMPLAEFRDSTLALRDLNNRALLELEESLAGTTCADQAVHLLDRFFLRTLRPLPPVAISALLQRIRHERGLLSIMDWIREQRIDSRNLERQFCDWTGMTPKRYARVIRFKHSYHQLITGRVLSGRATSGARGRGAVSSHLDGYYDQSHFHREFRYFTGTAPRVKLSGTMPAGTSVTDHLLAGEFAAG